MMIECPACATRYEVPENAIGPGGRNVRCAKCEHSWQVFREDGREDGEADQGDTVREEESRSAAGPPLSDPPAAAQSNPVISDFDDEPIAVENGESARLATSPGHATRRKGGARLIVWTVIIATAVAAAALLAARVLGMPDWVPGDRSSFSTSEPGLQLNFPDDQLGMRQLADGSEIFGASGTVTNVGDTALVVPPILIVLRDGHDRIVYSWEVIPPKRNLDPGESVAINEAVTDVPRSARVADIGWKPG